LIAQEINLRGSLLPAPRARDDVSDYIKSPGNPGLCEFALALIRSTRGLTSNYLFGVYALNVFASVKI
jgi:hypothetical protein